MAEVGEVEIVFTGLCSFLNLRNLNGTMPDPSVILPRTPAEVPHEPFIAFDSREVAVQPADGASPFAALPSPNNNFFVRTLDGRQLIIREDMPGWPNVLSSYDLIAKKDVYWPEARNKWNREFVPVGNDKPKPAKVAAFMYFGGGTISAERMTDFPWEFREGGTPTVRGYFAQELVYRIYPYQPRGETIDGIPASDRLTITLRSLGEPVPEETYTFTSNRHSVHKIKLWIGNNDRADIHRALLRLSSRPRPAVHFEYLNDVSDIDGIGPVPMPLVPRGMFPVPGPHDGGGSDTGYCGPHNAGE